MLADLQRLAVHAQHAVTLLATPIVATHDAPQLTRREVAVLALAREGLRSFAMPERMRVSESTINFHIANAIRKLGSANRIRAVNRAIDLGLL
jgi:DNA-binding NarL/FixJ family response regulator